MPKHKRPKQPWNWTPRAYKLGLILLLAGLILLTWVIWHYWQAPLFGL